jgi:uncharacterized membrane protein (DUF485 family)
MARTRRGPAARTQRKTDDQAYTDLARDPGFAELKRSYRRFAIPATVAFLVWYVTYVVCNNWARDFMDTRVVGHVNVALVFGLLQFLSTFVIAYLYSRYANRHLDPLSTRLRERFEKETGR